MNILKKVNLALLVLLSVSTGVVKIMGFEADVKIFENIGFSYMATVLFGIVQAAGGVLLIFDKTRKMAAIIMAVTFVIASAGVFASGMISFGVVSLLFIAMACLAYNTTLKTKQYGV